MPLEMNLQAWEEGYHAAPGARCPYPVMSPEACSWFAGRLEAAPVNVRRARLASRRGVTARPDADLHERFRKAVLRLRVSKQQALLEALEMWLRAHGEPPAE